jgi:hypothetical protein
VTKKIDKKEASHPNPVFAFGLDENGKPRGARFPQGLRDDIVHAALEMRCRVVQNHSAAFTAIGMRLPVGRVYASGKAFIPNIRRDLYDKLDQARQLPPEDIPGVTPFNGISEQSSEAPTDQPAVTSVPPMTSGLPRDWDTVGVGHMVLVFEGPGEGWWEAITVARENEILTLRYRDYPKVPNFSRHISTVALVNPGPG